MISLVKNLICISRLNIHYYPNRRYKSYITSLKALIVGKSLISAGLDIDWILHYVFYDKILQIYRQHWSRNFIDIFCQKTDKKVCVCVCVLWGGVGYTPPHTDTHTHTHIHTHLARYTLVYQILPKSKSFVIGF